MGHIIITHLSGSKVNQVEQLPLDGSEEFSFGRDPNSAITFDPDRDELVSRRHAVIRVEKTDPLSLTVSDVGSSNGTLVNGARIASATEIFPGDVIEFGAGGPKVRFDVEPRPPHFVAPARSFTQRAAPETRVTEPKTQKDTRSSVPAKAGVGAETVERMLSAERETIGRLWMYGLAGLLAVLAIIGGFLYYRNMQTQGEIETTKKAIDEKTADLVKKTGQMTPKDIAQSYADAVVLMNITWRLYHKSSGKPVFHKFVRINNEPMPAYVQLARDRIVRWLVTDDGEGLNRPIVAFMQGSGIVVDASGFILTNKHLAAGWFTAYSADYESNCNECGRLFIKGARDSQGGKAFTPQGDSLADRVPGDDGYLFEKKKAEVAPDGTDGPFEGRNEALEVAFPGQRANVQARFIRAMDEVDLALVKIDVPFKLKIWANLADVNDTPALGEKITVLGYPDVSERTLIEIISREAGREKDRTEVIPEPTLTEGVIANIGRGVRFSQERGSFYRTYGSMGDVYQLSATAGRGNSGGPVFNSAGKVIAIYTYAKRTDAGERFTFGVPIKYGHELLNLQGTWR